MTIHSKLASFIAAGIFAASLAAHAQTATAPDPNIAPSTAEEDSTLPPSPPSDPQLAMDPDPDVAPSTAGQEAQLPPSSPDSPQLATDPNPDLAPGESIAE